MERIVVTGGSRLFGTGVVERFRACGDTLHSMAEGMRIMCDRVCRDAD